MLPKLPIPKMPPTADDLLERWQRWKQADDAWFEAKAEICLLLARDQLGQVPDQELEDHAFELMKQPAELFARDVTARVTALQGKAPTLQTICLEFP